MAMKMVMPLLGQTMEEGTITRWLKKEGDAVVKGEPILEVMTDKANMEVEAPASGVLRKILALEEAVVPIKEPIAIIGTADESIDDLLLDIPAAPQVEAPVAKTEATAPTPISAAEAVDQHGVSDRVFSSPRARTVASENNIDLAALAGKGSGPGGRVVEKDVLAYIASVQAHEKPRITPLAGKIAADMGVDLHLVTATGAGGKITRDDVLRAQAPAPRTAIGRVIPLTGIRKAVAENVSRSVRNAPHVTLVMEVDMTECSRLRKQMLPEIEKNYGVKISFTDLIVKAMAKAIDDYPIVNATLENDQITIHDDIDIAIAVALEVGLITPVVIDVRAKSIPQISIEIKQLAQKARSGGLSPAEYQGGTITISNLGTYGVDLFNPIINPPQVAILGVCRIVDKPVIVEGQVQIRSMMNLCLSFDHRAMDGAPAAEYLARLKQILESPYTLFL
ncbi:MAG: dihydrolipoamide acetyltransferase family protein [Armatimonadota bacterium]|nr:dihydrolipoamide acetyltransferase family protein [Armatimonadota bacterium]